MNINFNIPDEFGNAFLSSSKLMLGDQPTWTDDKYINKHLKIYIGQEVDIYRRYQVLGADEAALAALTATAETASGNRLTAELSLMEKQRTYVVPPTDVP